VDCKRASTRYRASIRCCFRGEGAILNLQIGDGTVSEDIAALLSGGELTVDQLRVIAARAASINSVHRNQAGRKTIGIRRRIQARGAADGTKRRRGRGLVGRNPRPQQAWDRDGRDDQNDRHYNQHFN